MSPFIIYALPRSRTKWLSHFLSYGDWNCSHEIAIYMRSLKDVQAFFAQPRVGTVETAAAQGWRIINNLVPGIRQVVIRRPVEDVVRAMLAIDLKGVATYDETRLYKAMAYGDRMLAQVASQPGVLEIPFGALGRGSTCAKIFEFCLPYQFDRQWYQNCADKNLQVNVPEYISYYWQNFEAIKAFKSECWRELRRMARQGELRRAA